MKIDLLNLLKSSNIFSSLDDPTLFKILSKFKKVYLRRNKILFRQGELSNSLYLLVSGKIAAFITTEKNEILLINEVLPGSIIGELTALSHEPRSTTAKAVKGSILLQLTSEDFVDICKEFNSVSLEVINTTLRHSRDIIKLMSNKGNIKKHIAIIPANKQIDLKLFHETILKNSHHDENIVFLTDHPEDPMSIKELHEFHHYINQLDKENKTIVFIINSFHSILSSLCFGREIVDMIYVVGIGGSNPYLSQETRVKLDTNKYKIKPELILLHTNTQNAPKHTAKWLKLTRFNLHHHIRYDHEGDWKRLLRFITGNAIGIVFGGGGLRCWAHLGALKALIQLNIPIDVVGGASAGAIVAAYYALKRSYQNPTEDPIDLRELSHLTRQAISLKNLTWPSASLFDGKHYTQKLQTIFGKNRIENLWIPCFCISTNLANSKQIISRKGFLWKIIRGSTSLPFVFPPVVVNGQLHVDGGLLNNLPVDIMKNTLSNRGKIIAIELTRSDEDTNYYKFPPVLPFFMTMLTKFKLINKDFKFPHLIDTFLKSLLAGSAAKQEENGANADILIAPDLSKFGILRVSKSDEDELINIGYEETLKRIKKLH